jgi:hypothetical protein
MNKEEIIKILEGVLSIDGKGRPARARLLLSLIEEAPIFEFLAALKEIGERKYF